MPTLLLASMSLKMMTTIGPKDENGSIFFVVDKLVFGVFAIPLVCLHKTRLFGEVSEHVRIGWRLNKCLAIHSERKYLVAKFARAKSYALWTTNRSQLVNDEQKIGKDDWFSTAKSKK